MSRAFVLSGLLVGVLLSGCLEPEGPAEAGWTEDPETGVQWRHLTEEELRAGPFEGFQRVYVFRAPGVLEDLGEEDEVTFPVRVHGGFLEARLEFREEERHRMEGDDPRTITTRWFDAEGPWDAAALSGGTSFLMEGSKDGWRYRVNSVLPEWSLADDVRSSDLVNRVTAPCAEWGSAGDNQTAACVRYRDLEGY